MDTTYEVIVGNLGKIHQGHDDLVARVKFNEYVRMSKENYGRVADEPVTLFRNGEIVREYAGTQE